MAITQPEAPPGPPAYAGDTPPPVETAQEPIRTETGADDPDYDLTPTNRLLDAVYGDPK